MKAIKFDVDKVKACINAFYEEHRRYPYMIVSKKTKTIIPDENYGFSISSSGMISSSGSIKIGDNEYILKGSAEAPNYGTWYGAKIMIDNALEIGEVILG